MLQTPTGRSIDRGTDARKVPSLTEALRKEEPDERAVSLEQVLTAWAEPLEDLYPVWRECFGMTYEDQWGRYDADKRAWVPRSPAPTRKLTRLEFNHIQPIVAGIRAIHTAEPPSFGAVAGTSELNDGAAAEVCDDLMWATWDMHNLSDVYGDLVDGATVYGTMYLHPEWDATRGTPQMVAGPDGMPVFEYDGDFKWSVYTPFEVIPDPSSRGDYDGAGIAIKQVVSLQALQETFPETASEIAPSSVVGDRALSLLLETRWASPRSAVNGRGDPVREGVVVTTFYGRQTPDMPRGCHKVFAGGKMLYEGDNPVYPEEDEQEPWPTYHWPLFVFRDIPVPGAHHGQGTVVRLIGPQKALNGGASKELTILKKIAHATLVRPKGSNVVKTDEVDQVIETSTTAPPGSIYYLQAPQYPAEISNFETRIVSAMESIAGMNAASQGKANSADESGRAVQLRQQRDIGRRAPIKQAQDKAMSMALAYSIGRLFKRYANTERKVLIVGENRRAQIQAFDGSKIASGMDVKVFQDFARPHDPAQRIVWAQSMVQMGLVDPTDPIERAQMRELMGVGNFRRLEETLRSDRDKATRECSELYSGATVPVEFWEDDNQHLAVHFAEMNSQSWKTATTPGPGDTPESGHRKQLIRQAWILHVQAHMQQAQFKAGQMAPDPQMAAPGPGASPEAGSPNPGAPQDNAGTPGPMEAAA